jgi:thiol-disulfide isomerase/thioredoxin
MVDRIGRLRRHDGRAREDLAVGILGCGHPPPLGQGRRPAVTLDLVMRPLLLLLAFALLAAGCGTTESRAAGPMPEADRAAAPAIEGETLHGEQLALADIDGPVVVNFWASWCGPCVKEAPELANVARAYEDQGITVLGVNVKDSAVNARRFEADLGIPFPSWFDPASEIAAAFGGIGPAALPTTLVLDEDHRVAARLFGSVTFTQLRSYLDPLIVEAGGTPQLGTTVPAGEGGPDGSEQEDGG